MKEVVSTDRTTDEILPTVVECTKENKVLKWEKTDERMEDRYVMDNTIKELNMRELDKNTILLYVEMFW